jgi:hypothetical protein
MNKQRDENQQWQMMVAMLLESGLTAFAKVLYLSHAFLSLVRDGGRHESWKETRTRTRKASLIPKALVYYFWLEKAILGREEKPQPKKEPAFFFRPPLHQKYPDPTGNALRLCVCQALPTDSRPHTTPTTTHVYRECLTSCRARSSCPLPSQTALKLLIHLLSSPTTQHCHARI